MVPSLMTCAIVFALVSRSSAGKPNALKKRADSARSLTGRLTAILVTIGRSFPIGGHPLFVETLLQ